MNLSSLTLEDATVGLEKCQQAQVYKNGMMAVAGDGSIVHLLTLKKQKENEENEATPKSDDDVGGGSIVGSMLA